MEVVEQAIARNPHDTDALVWRAQVLAWSGRLGEAEAEYLKILNISRNDPDIWLGLAIVYLREGKNEEALRALDTAVGLDPERADLHAARGRALRLSGERKATKAGRTVLALESANSEARTAVWLFENEWRHELRFGQENDVFNFTGANHNESVSLVSRWNSQWATSVGGSAYQRAGLNAEKFVGSVTARARKWGALTMGGAVARDNTVVPKSEVFFDIDQGWKTSRTGALGGLEFSYAQHWYWYQAARILAVNGAAIAYFPRELTLTLAATGVRSAFSETVAEWRPTGAAKIGFPLAAWSDQAISGNVFFAAGTEDFAQVDQIGSFASQTYGGGLRFQLTARQDVRGYASYQKRTKGRTDTNFGFSYGIHF